jgi:malate dehydrogenase
VTDIIKHNEWLEKSFISTTFSNAARPIIKARGASGAASANAAIDTVRSLVNPTPAGDWNNVAVHTDGSYGVEKELISSSPSAAVEVRRKLCKACCQRILQREDRCLHQ